MKLKFLLLLLLIISIIKVNICKGKVVQTYKDNKRNKLTFRTDKLELKGEAFCNEYKKFKNLSYSKFAKPDKPNLFNLRIDPDISEDGLEIY
jgi:hypothetical protein